MGPRADARARKLISPELLPDHRVRFCLSAPWAREISLIGQVVDYSQPMSPDRNGCWSVTVGPLKPEIYEYSFVVDGMATIDPSNANVKPMRNPHISVCIVPGEPALPHDFRNVPHGTLHFHTYLSGTLGVRRGMEVYTPPGYESNSHAYPVLYLLPGSGDTERTWAVMGRFPIVLDNFLAEGRITPMIVVTLDGEAINRQKPRGRGNVNTEALRRDLIENIIPLVNECYRIKAGPQYQGILGVSRGGGQALIIGLRHRDLFGYIAGFSSAIIERRDIVARLLTPVPPEPPRLNLLYLACGTTERFILTLNKTLHESLTEAHISHEFVISDGSHGWPLWRRQFEEVAPRLFKTSYR